MALFECPRCGTKLAYASKDHPCKGGKSSDGGGKSIAAKTGNKTGATPEEAKYQSATSIVREEVRGAASQPCAGVAPGPSDWESLSPEDLAKKYPVTVGEYKGVVIRSEAKSKRGRPKLPDGAPMSRASQYRRRQAEKRSK